MPRPDYHIFICAQQRPEGHPRGSCAGKGAGSVLQGFAQGLTRRNLLGRAALVTTGCIGPCQSGANVLVYPGAVLYANVADADIDTIIEQHIVGGVPVAAKQLPAEVW